MSAADHKNAKQETPLELLASIAEIFVIGIFALSFIFQNFAIPSGSMEKALLTGDHVLVDRETFAPPTRWAFFQHYRDIQRGDVVVFIKPHETSLDLVKRVVGMPGDHIHLRAGIVYINGVAQSEPEATHPSPDEINAYRDNFPSESGQQDANVTALWSVEMPSYKEGEDLVVPAGNYFVMGDNRLPSLDSRFWGFVPRENILGRPMFVYWSFITPEDQQFKTSMSDNIAWYSHVVLHFFDQTLWTRTFHRIS